MKMFENIKAFLFGYSFLIILPPQVIPGRSDLSTVCSLSLLGVFGVGEGQLGRGFEVVGGYASQRYTIGQQGEISQSQHT